MSEVLEPVKQAKKERSSFKFVSIPVELQRYKDAIGIGLYAFSHEKFKVSPLNADNNTSIRKKVRIEFSDQSLNILNEAIKESRNTNAAPFLICDVVYSALLWLSKQPPHILKTKL